MSNNNIKAVIVEDDIDGAKLLAHIVKTHCEHIKLLGMAHDVDSALKLINTQKPNVLFLDVKLHEKTCFDLLDQINYDNLKIVFVTAHENYALEAIKHNAIDYLLKPIDIDEVVATTQKIKQQFFQENYSLKNQLNVFDKLVKATLTENYFAIPSISDIKFIKYNEILYLEADGRYTSFFLINKNKIIASKNIGEFESLLQDYGFYRIHKKFIINLNFVQSIDKRDGGTCFLHQDIRLPIAFRRKDALFRFLNLK